MTRGQKTSYTGKDTSVSITQTQAADQSQLTITNDRLRGEWSPRAIVERRYKKMKGRGATTAFLPISPRSALRGISEEYGEAFIIGYALVRPKVKTRTTRDDKDAVFEQFEDKDEAYVWKKRRPTYIPKDRLTTRFIIEGYGYNWNQPTDSKWGGMFYVLDANSMLSARDGFRVVAVAEVPPGTEFAYPFKSSARLKERLEDDAVDYTFDPDFERVA